MINGAVVDEDACIAVDDIVLHNDVRSLAFDADTLVVVQLVGTDHYPRVEWAVVHPLGIGTLLAKIVSFVATDRGDPFGTRQLVRDNLDVPRWLQQGTGRKCG